MILLGIVGGLYEIKTTRFDATIVSEFSKEKILFKPRERSLAADIITKSAIPNISDSSLLLEEEGEEENRRKKHIDDIFSKRKKYLI